MPEHTNETSRQQSIIASLTVDDAARAIDFYKTAFGAQEMMRMYDPSGQKIMHAELKIGNSVMHLSDEFPDMRTKSPRTLGGTTGGIYLYVDDVDSVFNTALEAGAQEDMAPEDMFWGDRMGSLTDPFGHVWAIATHKEEVSPEDMRKRAEEFFANYAREKA